MANGTPDPRTMLMALQFAQQFGLPGAQGPDPFFGQGAVPPAPSSPGTSITTLPAAKAEAKGKKKNRLKSLGPLAELFGIEDEESLEAFEELLLGRRNQGPNIIDPFGGNLTQLAAQNSFRPAGAGRVAFGGGSPFGELPGMREQAIAALVTNAVDAAGTLRPAATQGLNKLKGFF